MRHAGLAIVLVVLGCGDGAASSSAGAASSGSSSAASSGAGGGCPAACDGEGEVCSGGACVVDCRLPGATPCEAPHVCTVGDSSAGQCVAPDAKCVTTSEPEPCGTVTCGPGSRCNGLEQCWPAVPCRSVACDGGVCWGTSCPCTREIACEPAELGAPGQAGSLQDDAFRAGLVDLEFDPACTAWGATLISGPDYLRSVDPAGNVTAYPGVTNLNMGEVAVLQQIVTPASAPYPKPFDAPGLDVALAYICCATCGCMIDSTPQGVARLDPMTGELPLVVPSKTFTTGNGPFGGAVIDTGPEGVSYGLDRVLYVGNVDANGEYTRLDLATQAKTLLATLPSRVHASTPWDALSMLVALEGGALVLVRVDTGAVAPLATSPGPVTGLVRDLFDGTVYVATADGSILTYDGTWAPFAKVASPSRISIAPDGYLYALVVPPPFADVTPTVERFALPTER